MSKHVGKLRKTVTDGRIDERRPGGTDITIP